MEEYIKDAISASKDDEIIGLYDKELHDEMLKNTMIDNAKIDGIEIGKEEGITQKQIEIAKNMLKNGLDIEMIVKCTNLSKEEIEKI